MVKLALLLIALASPVSGAESSKFRFADPVSGAPATTAAELGLSSVTAEGILVYHDSARSDLAHAIAETLGRMYARTLEIIGIPLAPYGIVIVSSRGVLPEKVRGAHWLNVGGIPCLVRESPEDRLPLADAFNAYMLFPFLVHESVDVGIKRAFFDGRLTPTTVTSRWWVEGIADYAAFQACAAVQKQACDWMLANYQQHLAPLEQTLDLEDSGTWWPKDDTLPGDVVYAYAAAHYVIARHAAGSGDSWIARTFASLGPQPLSTDFCRAAAAVTGSDMRRDVRSVRPQAVREYFPARLK